MPRNINYPGYQGGGRTSVTRRQSRPIPFPKPDFLSDDARPIPFPEIDFLSDDARPIPFPEMDLSRFKLAGEGGGIEDDYEYGNTTQLEELFLRGDINQEQFDTAMEDQRQGYDRLSSRNSARYTESLARALAEDAQRRASGGIIGLQQGGPAPQMSAVTSYGVPQQTATQWAGLTDRIVAEGQRPYQQYGGQRLAGFTQPEAAAMAGQVAYGQGMGPMGTRQAAQTLGQAGQMIGGAQQGLMGLQPQYAQMAAQFGVAAPFAQQQAQLGALGMGQLGARAETQSGLLGGMMRGTGQRGWVEQSRLGLKQQQLGKLEAARQRGWGLQQGLTGKAAQTQMAGLGGGMALAGQGALAAQQRFGTGMVGMGTAAQQLGQQAMVGARGMGAGAQQLGQQAMSQMGTTGQGTARYRHQGSVGWNRVTGTTSWSDRCC